MGFRILMFIVAIMLLIGEVKCFVKMCQCNWEPIGKAEVVYTVGTFTGAGCIIGWMDIQDK